MRPYKKLTFKDNKFYVNGEQMEEFDAWVQITNRIVERKAKR